MLKIFALIALGVHALDRCSEEEDFSTPERAFGAAPPDGFCDKFCSKYDGIIYRGACGIQIEYTACYRVIALNEDSEVKPKFCTPTECLECLGCVNKGGLCECGSDCYNSKQGSPLDAFDKRLVCSRFRTG